MKAILFDFDGTVVDSQPAVNKAITTFLEQKNIFLDEHEKEFLSGMSIRDFIKRIKKTRNIDITEEEININDDRTLSQINLFPHARKTLALLKSRGYKTALVTNSPRPYIDIMFNKLHLHSYFDTTITVDESIESKPNPKMLELACKQLQVPHKNCVMIDDNNPGIEAGNILGMITVKIGIKETPQKAQHTISSVSELPKLLEKIHFNKQK